MESQRKRREGLSWDEVIESVNASGSELDKDFLEDAVNENVEPQEEVDIFSSNQFEKKSWRRGKNHYESSHIAFENFFEDPDENLNSPVSFFKKL